MMWYPIFLLIAFLEILYEVALSRRSSTALIQQGAIDVKPQLLLLMGAVYVVMFAGSLAEYFLRPRSISLLWALAFLLLFVSAKALKFWAIFGLGKYWTMKVLIIPGSEVSTKGPYKWMKHPNYVAVWMEIAAITLAGKNFYTFSFVFVTFSILLYFRIRSEEEALLRQTDYRKRMLSKRRFFPSA